MKKRVLICAGLICIGCLAAACGKNKDTEETVDNTIQTEDAAEMPDPAGTNEGSAGVPEETEEAEEIPDMPADFQMEGIYRSSGVILDDELFTMDQMVNDLGINQALLDMGLQFNGDGTGKSVAMGVEQDISYQAMTGPNGDYVLISAEGEDKALELEGDQLYLTYTESEVEETGAYSEANMILVFSKADAMPDADAAEQTGTSDADGQAVEVQEENAADDVTVVE